MIIFIPGKAKPNHGKILNKKGSGEAGPMKINRRYAYLIFY